MKYFIYKQKLAKRYAHTLQGKKAVRSKDYVAPVASPHVKPWS